MKKHIFVIGLITTTLLSVALRVLVPANPYYGLPHDDELVVSIARSILDGNWLGNYEQSGHMLLVKAPGYSIFLVICHWLSISPVFAVHILLLIGTLIIVREMRFLGVSRSTALVMYILFAFYPAWFNEQMSRIYRDGLLAAVVTISIGLTLMLRRQIYLLIRRKDYNWRRIVGTGLCGLALGYVISWYLISKSSWHLLIAFTGIALVSAISLSRKGLIRSAMYLGSVAVVIFVGILPMQQFVMQSNQHHFGVSLIDSAENGNFGDAMKAIYSVKSSTERPYVRVTKEAREAIYEISPTFLRLKPHLELPAGVGWRSQSCQSPLQECEESAAWFGWELRDAVQLSGLGNTAVDFERTLGRIASDIRDACREQRLSCGSEGISSGLDSLDSLSVRSVTDAFSNGVSQLLNPRLGEGGRSAMAWTQEREDLWRSVVRGLPATDYSVAYNANDRFLGDFRGLLGSLYSSIWILLIVGSLLIQVLPITPKDDQNRRHLRWITLAALGAIGIFLLQLSLLEASTGFIMIQGGQLYLLSAMPYVLLITMCGLASFDRIFIQRELSLSLKDSTTSPQ